MNVGLEAREPAHGHHEETTKRENTTHSTTTSPTNRNKEVVDDYEHNL